jgi:NADPH-dependent glutamate synthase beta subunit-like oxidoreductase/formate hydrogenlyase subunit 6/NADH:ubiquinone oxidoreductase subunit I/ferredoxin
VNTITLNINGKDVKTESSKTILEAALDNDIYIPTLCYHPDLSPFGACRLCIVEIEGIRGLPTSCTTMAKEGMVVKTNTPAINQVRCIAMELILASHPDNCLVCSQNLNCELQAVAQYLGVDRQRLKPAVKEIPANQDNPLFTHDMSKCILCGRCVRACYELRGVGILSFINRGKETHIGTAFDKPLTDADCRFCGACVEVCPTGALTDKNGILEKGKHRESVLVPCRSTCPAGIDIPRYIRFITEKRYAEAHAVIREKVPFPRSLGYACNHPCEDVCRRKDVNEAVSIKGLKRFAAESDRTNWGDNMVKAPATGKQVAIVGAGPAGLTAAFYLSKLGHKVTVFEALPVAGGMLKVGIPEYRLPKSALDAEIWEMKKTGFSIKTSTKIESIDELFKQGCHAVYLAIGAHKSLRMEVEGEDTRGVIDAVTFLRDISLGKPVKTKGRVAVIGGGNVATDAARSALRLGAEQVDMIYRRTRKEMPASEEEIEGCIEEGVNIIYLAAPHRIWNEGNMLKLQCVRMKLGEPDASGRQRPIPIEGSEFTETYNTIISAIGQTVDIPSGFNIEAAKGNRLPVGKDRATIREGVFGGGDAVTGPATIIEAIASGRAGAIAIDKYLGGKGVIDEQLAPVIEPRDCIGCIRGFAAQPREKQPLIDIEERKTSFEVVESNYGEAAAVKEANRCLQCDLRLKISPIKFPPKRQTSRGR